MEGIVYILRSLKNNQYYIGSTDNLKRRLRQHQQGKVKSTRNLLPLKLVYFQKYSDLKTARSIERKLKSLKSRKVIGKIITEQEIRIKI